jgi:hypothetical protein
MPCFEVWPLGLGLWGKMTGSSGAVVAMVVMWEGLLPSGHSSGFDSWRYQIFTEVMDLERGPLSLVSTIEELLGRKSSGSGLGSREYGRMDPSR